MCIFLHRLSRCYYSIRRTCECGNNIIVRYSNAATLHIDTYTHTHTLYVYKYIMLVCSFGWVYFLRWSDGWQRGRIRGEKTTILYVAVKENKNIYK